MMALHLAGRELRLLFTSPLPWVLLALGQGVGGWWFLTLVERYQTDYQPVLAQTDTPLGVTDLVLLPFFGSYVLLAVLLLAAALLAMRLLAEEWRGSGWQLLYSAPLRITELVLGKYLAGLAFLAVMVLSWLLMPLALGFGSAVDLGRLAATGMALMLVAAAMAGAALFASSLVAQPAVAVALTAAILLALLGLETAIGGNDVVTAYLALLPHYEALVRGPVVSVDAVYFLLLVAGFLAFAIKRLDAVRWHGG